MSATATAKNSKALKAEPQQVKAGQFQVIERELFHLFFVSLVFAKLVTKIFRFILVFMLFFVLVIII